MEEGESRKMAREGGAYCENNWLPFWKVNLPRSLSAPCRTFTHAPVFTCGHIPKRINRHIRKNTFPVVSLFNIDPLG